jgi:hypothetical protein
MKGIADRLDVTGFAPEVGHILEVVVVHLGIL